MPSPPAPPVPSVLFADRRFVVLDKPAGLAVHAGPRGGVSVEDCFPELRRQFGGHRDGPWLVHRLDADTSGCLLIALRRTALHAAQAAFAAGLADKVYWAVVTGRVEPDAGVVEVPLRKYSDRGGWRMRVDPDGVAATTAWQVRGRSPAHTWLELRPATGRTHQIRVHCASLGHPVAGDPVYGRGDRPMHLMSRVLGLPLDPPLAIVAPPPQHMLTALRECGWVDGR